MTQRLTDFMLCCCLLAPLFAPGAGACGPMPEHTGLVVDQTGLLDDDTQRALTRRLGAIQAIALFPLFIGRSGAQGRD